MLVSSQRLFDQNLVISKGVKPMHIYQMVDMFHHLYGRRNRLCFPFGLHELLMLMNQSFSELARSLRKNDPPEITGNRLANAVAWFCGVVDYFDDLPFADAFAVKYGKMECPYCQEPYCLCEPDFRPKTSETTAIVANSNVRPLSWWCHHFDRIYGKRNHDEGIYRIIAHLNEEVQEVLALTPLIAYKLNDLDKLEREFALELADVFAHLIAIANFQKIDLVTAIQRRYGEGCPVCQKKPCQCPRLVIVESGAQRIGSE